MAQPTLISYGNSNAGDAGTTDEQVAGVSWQTGDRVLVFGSASDNFDGNQLGVPTVVSGTGTGLTFSQLAAVNTAGGSSNDTTNYLWAALAAGNGSGTIQSVTAAAVSDRCVIGVFVYRGSDSLGTPVTLDNSTAKTISVTRTGANSHVALIMADWNAVNDTTVDATPAGTVRLANFQSGFVTTFIVSFGDQGATGTTAYGITNHTGTVDMSGIAVEILGSAGGGGATLRKNSLMRMGVGR